MATPLQQRKTPMPTAVRTSWLTASTSRAAESMIGAIESIPEMRVDYMASALADNLDEPDSYDENAEKT